MLSSADKIAGTGSSPDDAGTSRSSHSVTPGPDADARGTVCLDCGTDGAIICDSCLDMRVELLRRINESVQSLEDAQETGQYIRPSRPSWAGWKRVLWKCENCGTLKPRREFPSTNAPYVPAAHRHWCRSCHNGSES